MMATPSQNVMLALTGVQVTLPHSASGGHLTQDVPDTWTAGDTVTEMERVLTWSTATETQQRTTA